MFDLPKLLLRKNPSLLADSALLWALSFFSFLGEDGTLFIELSVSDLKTRLFLSPWKLCQRLTLGEEFSKSSKESEGREKEVTRGEMGGEEGGRGEEGGGVERGRQRGVVGVSGSTSSNNEGMSSILV